MRMVVSLIFKIDTIPTQTPKNRHKLNKIDTKMSKIDQIEMPIEVTRFHWELKREHDGRTMMGSRARWIEWNDDRTFKQIHDDPAIGRSLILDPHMMVYTWMTTSVTEITKNTEDCIEFNTENSTYKLNKI